MRVTRRLLLLLAAAATTAMMGTSGYAQGTLGTDSLYQDRGNRLGTSNKIWTRNDICGKESFQKFPDYTSAGAAQRDAYMRECLRRRHLPPRADVAEPLQPKE